MGKLTTSGGMQRMNRECGKKRETRSWVREEGEEPEKTNSCRHQDRDFKGKKQSTKSPRGLKKDCDSGAKC